jgi:hypothetical protein
MNIANSPIVASEVSEASGSSTIGNKENVKWASPYSRVRSAFEEARTDIHSATRATH